jgi:hypothetical protein
LPLAFSRFARFVHSKLGRAAFKRCGQVVSARRTAAALTIIGT